MTTTTTMADLAAALTGTQQVPEPLPGRFIAGRAMSGSCGGAKCGAEARDLKRQAALDPGKRNEQLRAAAIRSKRRSAIRKQLKAICAALRGMDQQQLDRLLAGLRELVKA